MAQKSEIRLLNATRDMANYKASSAVLKFEPRSSHVTLSNNDTTAEWTDDAQLSWIPVPTKCQLCKAKKVTWDFDVSHKGKQIGIGWMLDYTIGVDWGFFGYLGSSGSAWSYDPTTGDVVTDTESIEGNLPVFADTGVVSVELSLPSKGENYGVFIVNGKRSEKVLMPEGSVVVPAACFLAKNQTVTLKNLVVEEE